MVPPQCIEIVNDWNWNGHHCQSKPERNYPSLRQCPISLDCWYVLLYYCVHVHDAADHQHQHQQPAAIATDCPPELRDVPCMDQARRRRLLRRNQPNGLHNEMMMMMLLP